MGAKVARSPPGYIVELLVWAEQIPPDYSRAEENARELYARSE